MGYYGPMGFSIEIPAHQVGGPENLWGIRGYGLSEVWDMGVSTVLDGCVTEQLKNGTWSFTTVVPDQKRNLA